MKKKLTIIISLFLLILIQKTLFIAFFKTFPILPFLLVFFVNLFEKTNNLFGFFLSFLAGFFLDIFSPHFFGFWILIFLTLAFFIKFVFKKYVFYF